MYFASKLAYKSPHKLEILKSNQHCKQLFKRETPTYIFSFLKNKTAMTTKNLQITTNAVQGITADVMYAASFQLVSMKQDFIYSFFTA